MCEGGAVCVGRGVGGLGNREGRGSDVTEVLAGDGREGRVS